MKDDKDKREGQSGTLPKNPGINPRRDRLKQALRENLKRRKSQAKGRGDVAKAPSDDPDASLHHGSGKKPDE